MTRICLQWLIATAVPVVVTGCSYFVIGRHHTATIVDPEGLAEEIQVLNRRGDICFQGTAPATLLLDKGDGYMRRELYRVLYYDGQHHVIHEDSIRFRRSRSYWANLFFYNPVGFLLVDPCTGAMWISKDTLLGPATGGGM